MGRHRTGGRRHCTRAAPDTDSHVVVRIDVASQAQVNELAATLDVWWWTLPAAP
ncbi:MAG: hypothetical protein R3A10_17915 [Caldilineaceae bacterium]